MIERYRAMLAEVRRILDSDRSVTKLDVRFPFRDRYEHTLRVTRWAERLLETDGRGADADAVLTAAIWHDVGYALPGDESHGERSAALFRERASAYGIEPERAEYIAAMLAEHSQKDRLGHDVSLELTLLMEADELDESGAVAVLWDAMDEGARPGQSYRATVERIAVHLERYLGNARWYVTPEARRVYEENCALLTGFVRRARRDLEAYEP